MRIVFMMKHPSIARNFESSLRALAERGHVLELAFDNDKGVSGGGHAIVRTLCSEFQSVTAGRAPKPGRRRMARMARALRLTEDYLRYLDPRYAAAEKLRARARSQAPDAIVRLLDLPLTRHRLGLRALRGIVTGLERLLPAPDRTVAWLREHRPDVLLISPLVGLGSRQADHVRAARQLGIPVLFLVYSWDNLTNKGLIRDCPDGVLVWNEAQRLEAAQLHGIPNDRIALTGAPAFDRWFKRFPSRVRATFLADVGLPQAEALVLYVCSSPFIAPDEVAFVRRWIASLRQSGDQRVRDAAILVRPHPQNASQWKEVDLEDARVAVWPRHGANPDHESARADFYDSLYYAAAVMGVNTSAMIEAAIVNRPVFTVLDAQFTQTQEGTLHFRHIADPRDGMLHVADSLDAHVRQLGEALRSDKNWRERNRHFVETFVRPHGIDNAVTPRLADAIEHGWATPAIRPATGVRLARQGLSVCSRRVRRTRRHARRVPPPTGSFGVPAVARQAVRPPERDAVAVAREAVRHLAEQTDGPILAGPWISEVGYELMYWVPFLRWALEEHPGLAERLTIVSRGGSEHWYEQLGVRYTDLFDLYEPDDLRLRRELALGGAGGLSKQMRETPFEAALLAEVAEHLALTEYVSLHPSVMYKAYWRLVKLRELLSPRRAELFRHKPMAIPDPGVLATALPESFVAVRFYFRASFPETHENVVFARRTIELLAEQTDVVLLNPSIRVDDHWDFEPSGGGRVIRLDHLMTPRTNLGVQTTAVARARAFVGTYGGLSYLPPLLGVRSESVFSDPTRFKQHHMELAEATFAEPGFGPFAAHDTHGLDPRSLLPATVL